MSSLHPHTFIRYLTGLTLSLAATGAGIWAYQPPVRREAKSEASTQPKRQDEQKARTDRYGDPLPHGAVWPPPA